MLRSKSALILGLCSVLTLTACSEAVDTAQDAGDTAKDAATEVVDTAQDAGDAAKDAATDAAEKAQDAGEAAKDAVTETAEKAKDAVTDVLALKDGVTGMKGGVEATITAVQAGDLTKAKEEFGKLQDSWSKIEENVKTQSGDSYQKIEDGMATVKSALSETEPNKDKLVTDLKGLLTSLSSIVTS